MTQEIAKHKILVRGGFRITRKESVMKRSLSLCAAFALLSSLATSQHNGTKSWLSSRLLVVLPGASELFLAMQGTTQIELVPVRSILLIGAEVVVRTRAAIETKVTGGPVAFALVTHGDEALHQRCLEELFDGPLPHAMAAPVTQLATYYVDSSWQVHKVTTDRQGKETPLSHARRHKVNLTEYQLIFPPNKENTEKWALAKAGNADTISAGK